MDYLRRNKTVWLFMCTQHKVDGGTASDNGDKVFAQGTLERVHAENAIAVVRLPH